MQPLRQSLQQSLSTQSPLLLAQQLAREIATRAAAADQAGQLPEADVRLMQTSGYLALPVPREYGGLGLGLRDCVAAHLEFSQGSASTGIVAAMPLQVMGNALETQAWSEAQLADLSRAVVQEGAILNAAASEPAMGSPSRGKVFQSQARRSDEGYIINGHKTWVTGGRHLTHMLVKLMVEDQPGTLLVRNPAPGITWEDTWQNALSLRASDSHDVYFENVLVPHDALLEGEDRPTHINAWFPMLISAVYLGTAIAARDSVISFALERVPRALGKPIATLPKIQRQIGEMDVALQAARALLLEAAADWDQQPAARPHLAHRIAAAKHQAVNAALFATELALQIAGGRSLSPSLPLERQFRDVRAGSMQPPAADTALEMVGRGAIASLGDLSQYED